MSAKPNAVQQPSALQSKSFKRGELLISSSNKRPTHFYVIQSGLVSACAIRESAIQLQLVHPGQCVGEEGYFGGPPSGVSAVALRDTVAYEIPIEYAKAQVEASHPMLKPLVKGLLERVKVTSNEIRAQKMAREAKPCPPELVAKVFGVIFHSARHLGTKSENATLVSWEALKDYALNVFEEDLNRIQEGIHILIKLGYAEAITQPVSAERFPTPELWKQISFRNMAQIETFFDFYQNYFFKSGYASLLKTNDKVTEITQALVRIASSHKADRGGMVTLPYQATMNAMKEIFGKTFEADQIFRLDQKGLMIKRLQTQDAGALSFLKAEFEQMLLNWKLLKEVELWNERGYVDLTLPVQKDKLHSGAAVAEKGTQASSETDPMDSWKPLILAGGVPQIRNSPPKAGELLCSVCMAPITKSQKYCSICDSEIIN